MTIQEFQKKIEDIYYHHDDQRGILGCFTWFIEEVGELSEAIRKYPRDKENLYKEFADVLAWIATMASLLNIDLEDVAQIYANGCPRCKNTPCSCF